MTNLVKVTYTADEVVNNLKKQTNIVKVTYTADEAVNNFKKQISLKLPTPLTRF